MDTFDVIMTAWSNRDLKPAEFERQVAMIKPVMAWDPTAWAWRARLSSSRAERVAEVINTLFEAARVYGTTVTVAVVPAERADESAATDTASSSASDNRSESPAGR
jgi:hypothetical protein